MLFYKHLRPDMLKNILKYNSAFSINFKFVNLTNHDLQKEIEFIQKTDRICFFLDGL